MIIPYMENITTHNNNSIRSYFGSSSFVFANVPQAADMSASSAVATTARAAWHKSVDHTNLAQDNYDFQEDCRQHKHKHNNNNNNHNNSIQQQPHEQQPQEKKIQHQKQQQQQQQ